MKLSKSATCAALALVYLAKHATDRHVKGHEVAAYLGVPADSALKMLQTLGRQHLVASQLGRSGGYRLGRPAEQITLLEVVEAIDGPMQPGVQMDVDCSESMHGRVEVLSGICEQVTDELRERLRAHTVADLLHGRMVELQQAGASEEDPLAESGLGEGLGEGESDAEQEGVRRWE